MADFDDDPPFHWGLTPKGKAAPEPAPEPDPPAPEPEPTPASEPQSIPEPTVTPAEPDPVPEPAPTPAPADPLAALFGAAAVAHEPTPVPPDVPPAVPSTPPFVERAVAEEFGAEPDDSTQAFATIYGAPRPEPTVPESAEGPDTTTLPDDETDPVAEAAAAATALDALFGEENFQDYDDSLIGGVPPSRPAPTAVAPIAAAAFAFGTAGEAAPAASPLPTASTERIATPAGPDGSGGSTPPPKSASTQRTLVIIAGSVVAVLILIALFLVGTRIPSWTAAPEPAPTSTTPTPTPTPTPEPVGPVPPGPAVWDEMRGGECLDPYTSPWERTFTVVDCAAPHPAQMTYRGVFADAAVWPGEAALAAQLNLACTSDAAINLAIAGQWADMQVQGTYPVSAEQWDGGDHYYYCFASRSSGEPLVGDLSIPVAPAG